MTEASGHEVEDGGFLRGWREAKVGLDGSGSEWLGSTTGPLGFSGGEGFTETERTMRRRDAERRARERCF